MKSIISRLLFYKFACHLPASFSRYGGRIFEKIRYILCRNIFEYCGRNVNIEHGVYFGSGHAIRIGDNSGMGVNCNIPNYSVIGKDVMMGPNLFVHSRNHRFDRTDIPMRLQGYTEEKPLIIEDDVWIGRNVTIMVGRKISQGTIVAANSVVTKDFPPYSIIGCNPAKLIRSRK